MKILLLTGLLALCLIVSGSTIQFPVNIDEVVAVTPTPENPAVLSITPIRQAKTTSCGEAVIVMAYNYAYPETQLDEAAVIEYAAENGFYTSGAPPFTSPANMVNIVDHYVDDYETGHVSSSSQGLGLLKKRLQMGQPVIIDIITRLNDEDSGAHFILVTGMTVDPEKNNAVAIHYNDPLSGKSKSAPWNGSTGIWNAWQTNGDPGGSGWWLAITPE